MARSGKLAVGTYRLTLIHEQTGQIAIDRGGMDASRVEQVLVLLQEAAPILMAATGARAAWVGVEQALDGLEALGASVRRKGRGRK